MSEETEKYWDEIKDQFGIDSKHDVDIIDILNIHHKYKLKKDMPSHEQINKISNDLHPQNYVKYHEFRNGMKWLKNHLLKETEPCPNCFKQICECDN